MVASGIYAITNLENGNAYIGSTNNFKRRWYDHRSSLCGDTHWNGRLQSAWNKYGENAFEFGILEYLENFEELTKAEQFWMDVYREEGKELYNFGLAADCPWRGQERSEEHRRKLGKAHRGKRLSEEHKRKISESLIGNQHTLDHTLSEEHKRKISEGNRGHKHTEESKQKMSMAATGRVFSEDHKSKLREAWKTRPPVSEETRQRLVENHKGMLGKKHTEKTKRRISKSRRGQPVSEETRRKLGKSATEAWARIKGGSK